MQGGNSFDELLERAPQTIQAPNDEDIASADKLQCLMEACSLCGTAAGRVGENLRATDFMQCIILQVESLVLRRDASIADEHLDKEYQNSSRISRSEMLIVERILEQWIEGSVFVEGCKRREVSKTRVFGTGGIAAM